MSHNEKFRRIDFCCPFAVFIEADSGSTNVVCFTDEVPSYQNKGKGKAVTLQGWSGPEGSRKLRFPDFMTTAQDGGKFVSLTHRPRLPPGNTPRTNFC
jgi:hypothetical protein